jgi:hypothetical protein
VIGPDTGKSTVMTFVRADEVDTPLRAFRVEWFSNRNAAFLERFSSVDPKPKFILHDQHAYCHEAGTLGSENRSDR